MRRITFVESGIYHICNKSISHFEIFHSDALVYRFLAIVEYFNSNINKVSYSQLDRYNKIFVPSGLLAKSEDQIMHIIAYCIMPTHYHILLKQVTNSPGSLNKYISRIENSYTRYFNLRNNRKGPLWQSRFRATEIVSDEQYQTVVNYIHFNPVKAMLVDKPEEWKYTSYGNI